MHKIEQLDEAQATPISHLNNNIKKPDKLAQNNSNYPEKLEQDFHFLIHNN